MTEWLAKALPSCCPKIRRFAGGNRQDMAAVSALMEQWSNGPVEGQVNRLKLIKRSMFGRAGFQLLRAKALHAANRSLPSITVHRSNGRFVVTITLVRSYEVLLTSYSHSALTWLAAGSRIRPIMWSFT